MPTIYEPVLELELGQKKCLSSEGLWQQPGTGESAWTQKVPEEHGTVFIKGKVE